MKLSKLKELLETEAITQEEFDQLKETAEDDTKDDDKDGKDDLEERIQRAVDRATNKLGNENKTLKEKLAKLEKEKLSDEERAELEKKEKEEELNRRERELRDKENRLYAVKAIRKAKLDDGSDTSLDLIDFVMAETEEEIDKRVKAFGELVNKLVKAEVEKTFKENGGNPKRGAGGGGTADNPDKKEPLNLTKQMELEINNPEEAKRLKAEAEGK